MVSFKQGTKVFHLHVRTHGHVFLHKEEYTGSDRIATATVDTNLTPA